MNNLLLYALNTCSKVTLYLLVVLFSIWKKIYTLGNGINGNIRFLRFQENSGPQGLTAIASERALHKSLATHDALTVKRANAICCSQATVTLTMATCTTDLLLMRR